MKIESHLHQDIKIAEVISDLMIIGNTQDAVDLLGNLYYQEFDKIIICAHHITPEFFNLKSGIAGEILQKFSNYRVRLAIIGDFSPYSGDSIKAFILESNRRKHINFVASLEEAIAV